MFFFESGTKENRAVGCAALGELVDCGESYIGVGRNEPEPSDERKNGAAEGIVHLDDFGGLGRRRCDGAGGCDTEGALVVLVIEGAIGSHEQALVAKRLQCRQRARRVVGLGDARRTLFHFGVFFGYQTTQGLVEGWLATLSHPDLREE